jgi:predicted nucleic acid-binding protein
MTKQHLLFDANAIYRLIREFPEAAPDILSEGSTSQLAYYELGNALWKESLLLKRISEAEAEKSLDFLYKILERMQVIALNSNAGSTVLETAFKLELTFYDSAYLTEANKTDRVLVTDDKKLAKAAENLGVKTLSSMAFMEKHTG